VVDGSTVDAGYAGAWAVAREWDAAAEVEFSTWIANLGARSKAHPEYTLDQCLADPAINTLLAPGEVHLSLLADCSKVPAVLRAYFASKTARPFLLVSAINGERYGKDNTPASTRDQRSFPDLRSLLRFIDNHVDTGFFRMAPDVEGTDTYPIAIHRDTVVPGTVFYDPNGHILLVYQVSDDGQVYLIDGHPDNSLTHSIFGPKYEYRGAALGGGFRAFRPFHQYAWAKNAELPNYDAGGEQHQSPSYDLGGGRAGSYYDWVRARLAVAGAKIDPVANFETLLDDLRSDLRDRVSAVNKAIRDGISTQPHPAALPDNIFGATGDWETYSTCARDVRLKVSFARLRDFVSAVAGSITARDDLYAFTGTVDELFAALRDKWHQAVIASQGEVRYEDTSGETYALNLDDVADRLFLLSFDPYHGPELRWGASPGPGDTPDKIDWYAKERRLRNSIERVVDRPTPLDFGPEDAPDVDLRAIPGFSAA